MLNNIKITDITKTKKGFNALFANDEFLFSSKYHVFLPRLPPPEIILKPFSLALKNVGSSKDGPVVSAFGESTAKIVTPIKDDNKTIINIVKGSCPSGSEYITGLLLQYAYRFRPLILCGSMYSIESGEIQRPHSGL